MALSWNEIRARAVSFSKEWETASSEKSEAQSFMIAFFNVFGVSNRRVRTFEYPVKKIDDTNGYIDVLWRGNILVEMKSRGVNLDGAYRQAKGYCEGLKDFELPKYILLCDFHTFRLYDLDKNENENHIEFTLDELYKNVQLFGFIAGYTKVDIKQENPVNVKAAEAMGRLHDQLKSVGYKGHHLELYLVRLLFCMFADDTTIFNKNIFYEYILNHSAEDGSNLASVINEVFEVLNTPEGKRLKNITEELNMFPYVNGKLFEERLPLASFDRRMRDIFLGCCALDWGGISPAIFGSMFQSVMNATERRNLGAHYTSETNILKVIKPLFLDDLWAEFESVKNSTSRLKKFHSKLSTLTFLDPACGCGNFLVITYREIRLLELEVVKILLGGQLTDISTYLLCDVDNFYGIEYEEFPAQIAQVALWLLDHQMNMMCSEALGEYYVRLPLKKSARIVHGDALQRDWKEVIEPTKLSYIIGNPPFMGHHLMSKEQKDGTKSVFDNIDGVGILDYVTAWYVKAAQYIQGTKIKVALVSTNSIVQGEQVGILWNVMFNKYNIHIHFAHRTFRWSNDAKGNAAVYCVIIGFANFEANKRYIFDYEDIKGAAHKTEAKNINPYLIDAPNILISNRQTPICNVPSICYGNKPVDGGNLLFTDIEKIEFLAQEPNAEKFFKPLISAKEFLNNKKRWCLWLVDATPIELNRMPKVLERVERVKRLRMDSVASTTRKFAEIPHLFAQLTQPKGVDMIVIPCHSSENRKYIPMGFFDKSNIVNNSCHIVPSGTIYHFGVLTSAMHMAWVKYVCGRLKSDYRYSKDIVYNNFPWAKEPTKKQKDKIEECAQKVLEAREQYPDSSLADLYNPLTMPPNLVKAHNDLDKAVDSSYRSSPSFQTDSIRIAYLLELYNNYNATLFTEPKPKRKTKK